MADEDRNNRSKGRPSRGVGRVGRDHLIESTRRAMRNRPRLDLKRREIAASANVTPALVSYYFPDRASLIEVAAEPVIDAFVGDVRAILRDDNAPSDKLLRLIELFLKFNGDHGYILDHYLQTSVHRSRGVTVTALRDVQDEAVVLFERLTALGNVTGDCPRFTLAALWAVCRAFGGTGRVDLFSVNQAEHHAHPGAAEKVLCLFVL